MKTIKYILVLIIGLFFLIGCENNPLLTQVEDTATVEINLGMQNETTGLYKSSEINRVILHVSGPDFDTITKQLTINTSNNTAEGTIDIKKGDSRKFEVEGLNQDGDQVFVGSTTKDLKDDNETINIINIQVLVTSVTISIPLPSDFVNSVVLQITGSGFDTQTKQLNIQTQNSQLVATGTFDVKKGSSRTFEVEGRDAGENRLFHGSRTVDLNEEELTISIPIQWDPFQVVYDDNEFNEGWYADEPYTEFITQFISPITPVHVIGARVYGASPLGHSFNYDIDFYDTNGDYIDTYDATLSNSNGDWNSYDLTSMGLNFTSDFYVSLYFYDGPDNSGAYGPVIGLDTDSQGNSYYYLPSTDVTNSINGHWGLRVIVEVGGVTKELVPANVQLHTGNEKSLRTIKNSASFTPQIGLLEQFDLAEFE